MVNGEILTIFMSLSFISERVKKREKKSAHLHETILLYFNQCSSPEQAERPALTRKESVIG